MSLLLWLACLKGTIAVSSSVVKNEHRTFSHRQPGTYPTPAPEEIKAKQATPEHDDLEAMYERDKVPKLNTIFYTQMPHVRPLTESSGKKALRTGIITGASGGAVAIGAGLIYLLYRQIQIRSIKKEQAQCALLYGTPDTKCNICIREVEVALTTEMFN